jgi:hypothetical protein
VARLASVVVSMLSSAGKESSSADNGNGWTVSSESSGANSSLAKSSVISVVRLPAAAVLSSAVLSSARSSSADLPIAGLLSRELPRPSARGLGLASGGGASFCVPSPISGERSGHKPSATSRPSCAASVPRNETRPDRSSRTEIPLRASERHNAGKRYSLSVLSGSVELV